MMSTYSIESEALPITIDFEVKKLLVFTVRGKFTRTSGEVYFEENNLEKSFFDLKVNVKSIDTGNAKREIHLMGKDFFDAEKYATIGFRSQKINASLDGFFCTGYLTIKDLTHKIDVNFQQSSNKALHGLFKLDRKKFEVGTHFPNAVIGTSVVIKFNLEIGAD